MKKLTIILALFIAMPAFAEEAAETPTKSARDNSIGIRLHKNERMDFEFENGIVDRHVKDDQFGFGATIGNKLTEHVKVEFETSYTGANFWLDGYVHDYDIWSNMINMYMFSAIDGVVEPYVGLGLGISAIFADARGAAGNLRETALELSWQLMAGVSFALNERVDLNVGFKYQNYGDVKFAKSGVAMGTTDIDATEFYFGAAYKFGL
ncbi:MAG: outer membrane beta-barrel protein [Rickettsiales bacterium]|jgi:opacity protein-like surface antigen|nr:outer membrane beta-barrel protein [Rickettsiales bacterium]